MVSDKFIIQSASTLTRAHIGVWAKIQGSVPVQVDWSIGTSAFSSDMGSGISTLEKTFKFQNASGANIYDSEFTLYGILTPGAYWLTLQNGVMTSSSDYLAWDRNSLGGDARSNMISDPIPSETFQIYGNALVPEPATMLLLVSGMVGVAGIRRKMKK